MDASGYRRQVCEQEVLEKVSVQCRVDIHRRFRLPFQLSLDEFRQLDQPAGTELEAGIKLGGE